MIRNGGIAVVLASVLALTACSGTPDEDGTAPPSDDATAAEGAEITLWLAGADTPQELRDYLVDTFAAENPGSTLVIEEQSWTTWSPS